MTTQLLTGGLALATEVGALNVDMFDTQSKKLVWRGQASKSLSSNPEKNAKKLQSDINGLFKDSRQNPTADCFARSAHVNDHRAYAHCSRARSCETGPRG